MTKHAADTSRRSFIKLTVTGLAAAPLANGQLIPDARSTVRALGRLPEGSRSSRPHLIRLFEIFGSKSAKMPSLRF